MLFTYHDQCASKIIYLELMYSSKTLSYDCQFLDVNVDYIVSLIICSCSFYNHLKILIPFPSTVPLVCLITTNVHCYCCVHTLSPFAFGD